MDLHGNVVDPSSPQRAAAHAWLVKVDLADPARATLDTTTSKIAGPSEARDAGHGSQAPYISAWGKYYIKNSDNGGITYDGQMRRAERLAQGPEVWYRAAIS